MRDWEDKKKSGIALSLCSPQKPLLSYEEKEKQVEEGYHFNTNETQGEEFRLHA
jgi:hypothetical protein